MEYSAALLVAGLPDVDESFSERDFQTHANALNSMVFLNRLPKVKEHLKQLPDPFVGDLLNCSKNFKCPLERALLKGHYDMAKFILSEMIRIIPHVNVFDLFHKDICGDDTGMSIFFKILESSDLTAVSILVDACAGDPVPFTESAKFFKTISLHDYVTRFLKDPSFQKLLQESYPGWFLSEDQLETESASRAETPRHDDHVSSASSSDSIRKRKSDSSSKLSRHSSNEGTLSKRSSSKKGSSPKISLNLLRNSNGSIHKSEHVESPKLVVSPPCARRNGKESPTVKESPVRSRSASRSPRLLSPRKLFIRLTDDSDSDTDSNKTDSDVEEQKEQKEPKEEKSRVHHRRVGSASSTSHQSGLTTTKSDELRSLDSRRTKPRSMSYIDVSTKKEEAF